MDSLIGIKSSEWRELLQKNNYGVSPSHYVRAAFISALSIRNSYMARTEEAKFGTEIDKTVIGEDPVFVIGHWRSGTTFLNNILANDEQFAYPTVFENNHPHIFLRYGEKLKSVLENRHKRIRPTDNVVVKPTSPGEEEFALAVITLMSPMLGWVFPKNAAFYERYTSFADVSVEEREKWKQAYLWYLKKQSFAKNRQLLLKSPLNTARIALLLELFPNARFIHIHRNPYNVFKSTVKLYQTAISKSALHSARNAHSQEDILERYKHIYDCYFEQSKLIPQGQLKEVGYDELVSNPIETIECIYSSLQLKSFDLFLPQLEDHLKKIAGYKKNVHDSLPAELKNKVSQKWKRSFEHWGYPL